GPVQDHRRRPVLRAQGNQGCARLPEADHQPARRCEPAAGDQRGRPRPREGGRGVAGGERSPGQRRPRARAPRGGGGRRDLVAVAPPLLAAGLAEVSSARSLWARLVYAVDEAKLGNRAVTSLRVFRDMIVSLANDARTDTVSIAIGKMLDRSGYLQDLRDE